ncbi:hypothetical protein F5887DRAFT_1277681 [Amanita rubescens]|nr:hypothetical protein F5887DRAFT_1277681 [Amanita rubescens]
MATTSSTSPSVTVTADGLAHALDKMGLTESVSAASLYDTILRLQSPGPGNAIPQTAKEGSPVEHRRPPRVMMRAYPGPISLATALRPPRKVSLTNQVASVTRRDQAPTFSTQFVSSIAVRCGK